MCLPLLPADNIKSESDSELIDNLQGDVSAQHLEDLSGMKTHEANDSSAETSALKSDSETVR